MSWHIELLHRDGTVLAHLEVGNKPLIIGRAADCDLVIDDPHVAAHHARVMLDDNGQVLVEDLNTINGIRGQRGKRLQQWRPSNEDPVRLGQSQIRVRSTEWPLAAERPLQSMRTPLLAAVSLLLCVGAVALMSWVSNVSGGESRLLTIISTTLAMIGLWAGAFALLGRLLSGHGQFARHLTIVTLALLGVLALDYLLESLAFAFNWLLPVQLFPMWITVFIAVAVGIHLRLADPRHWRVMRWVLTGLALATIFIPIAQTWQSEHRWTTDDRMGAFRHPALILADMAPATEPLDTLDELRSQVEADKARTAANNSADGEDGEVQVLD